ncbi:phosphatase [Candidatus Woesebacteria bacterium GWA1_41_8]|uniref:Phosphatase n=1 Tax=Candidatus Woesebacteria bacterium GWA1_41_8 TaxID=1802471 RepID=A0A1F7WIY2_9BACT|nr:MAG: phosphatase [Candidatus Woesebacteria bacterium GWA1_41_8]
MRKKPKNFIIDLDGVMTDGRFYYTVEGKVMKAFGADDHDALLLLKPFMNIVFITGDRKGFKISKKRIIDDMKFPLKLVSTLERVKWMEENGYRLDESVYMGDGIFDTMVFDKVAYGIAPANAFYTTKEYADFVTLSMGGYGAVAEACLHLMKKFFTPFNPLQIELKKSSGEWGSTEK